MFLCFQKNAASKFMFMYGECVCSKWNIAVNIKQSHDTVIEKQSNKNFLQCLLITPMQWFPARVQGPPNKSQIKSEGLQDD